MRSSVFTIASALLLSCVSSGSHVQALKSRDNAVIPGYTDEGCYTEATSERALSAYTYNNGGMTVELCAAACVGYTYFGVEYGTQCYCGNSLNAGSVPAPPSDCNFPCPGNATEFCGAGNRLNVYSDATSTAPPQLISTYNALGCFTETPSGRALSDLSTAANFMSVEVCGTFCVGYNYFGVEYGRECYCGYKINSGSNQVAASECIMACEGSSSETCGGSLLLNMYHSLATPTGPITVPSVGSCTWIGCYTEGTYTRALNNLAIYDYNLMSPEICAAGCAGYDMFGVEYGGECYCGNVLQSGSNLVDPSDCHMPCDGTPNEYCGAGNRLDVYNCASPSSSSTVSGTATSTSPYVPPILTSAPTCNGDNCLNELRDPRFSSEASAFCS
ncbi:WSC-domain-containing protein, partial [Stipitochalara longipes BDJ]